MAQVAVRDRNRGLSYDAFALRTFAMRLPAIVSLLFLFGASCVGEVERGTQASAKATPRAPASPPEPKVLPKPTFVPAPVGDVVLVAKSAVDSAPAPQRVLVYVGAEWCEPCTRFHKAVEAGALDEELAGVVFLEFDSDRDAARLAAAGYNGKLIPRFVRPTADGSASAKRIEGGVKGDRAVDHIMSRLRPLLEN